MTDKDGRIDTADKCDNTDKGREAGVDKGLVCRAWKHSYDLRLLRFECLKRILGLALANIIKVAQADKIDTNDEGELIKVYKF